MTRPMFEPQDHMIAFDMDSTLVQTKSGNKFPNSSDDFEYTELVDSIPNRSNIVIFTNQSYRNEDKLIKMVKRVNNVMKRFRHDVAIKYYIGYVLSAKPSIHLFNEYVNDFKLPKTLLFVGDAAGREDDFSNSDYKFALNIKSFYGSDIKVKFMTPEQYMNRDNMEIYKTLPKPQLYTHDFIPKKHTKEAFAYLENQKSYIKEIAEIMVHDKTMVMLVGPPYCGSDRLCEQIINWANKVNPNVDIYYLFGTNKQIMEDIEELSEEHNSMFISRSINKEEDRKKIMDKAHENNINTILIYWDMDQLPAIDHYIHTLEQINKAPINRNEFNNYKKHIEEPNKVDYYWKFDTFLYDTDEFKYYNLYK